MTAVTDRTMSDIDLTKLKIMGDINEVYTDETNIINLKSYDGILYSRNDNGKWKQWPEGKVISETYDIYVKDGKIYEWESCVLKFNGKSIRIDNSIKSILVDDYIYIGDSCGKLYIYDHDGNIKTAAFLNDNGWDIYCITKLDGKIYACDKNITRIQYETNNIKAIRTYNGGDFIHYYDGNYIITYNYVGLFKDGKISGSKSIGKCVILKDKIINFNNKANIYDLKLQLQYTKRFNYSAICHVGETIYYADGNKIKQWNPIPNIYYICSKCQMVAFPETVIRCDCGSQLDELNTWILKEEDIKPSNRKMVPIHQLKIEEGELSFTEGVKLENYILEKHNNMILGKRKAMIEAVTKNIEDQLPLKKSKFN